MASSAKTGQRCPKCNGPAVALFTSLACERDCSKEDEFARLCREFYEAGNVARADSYYLSAAYNLSPAHLRCRDAYEDLIKLGAFPVKRRGDHGGMAGWDLPMLNGPELAGVRSIRFDSKGLKFKVSL